MAAIAMTVANERTIPVQYARVNEDDPKASRTSAERSEGDVIIPISAARITDRKIVEEENR